MKIERSMKFDYESLSVTETLTDGAICHVTINPHEIERIGDDLKLLYYVEYDGYETQGFVRYNASYQDDEYKASNNYSAWDTPYVALESFDCMYGGINWRQQAEMLTLMLEFNEQIMKTLGVLDGPLGVTE